jgi:hypothetical protein
MEVIIKVGKSNLIEVLYEILEGVNVEHHNDTTFIWSKGYRKAIQDIIDTIENIEL